MKREPPAKPTAKTAKPAPRPEDLAWAREKVTDLFFSFTLNQRLVSIGLVSKYIHEMDEKDIGQYGKMLERLFARQE